MKAAGHGAFAVSATSSRNLRKQRGGKTRGWWIVTRCTLIAVLICGSTYLVGLNSFLYFNGLQLLFKSTNTVNATYQRAFSVWPGVVHVKGLRVVFQDKNLQWSLDIDHVNARISVTELMSRRFHATRVEGSGAAFRMRHRVQPETKDEPWMQTLPPIREFIAPAVFEATVLEPPIPDNKYNLWTVHLENVDVGVKEVWIQFVRYLGTGRARGTFQLVPARNLWVGPASLDLDRGRATFGNESVGTSLSGRITCKVDRFDVRLPQGREVFRYINTDITLLAQSYNIMRFFQFFAPPDLHMGAAPGHLAVSVRVRRGRVMTGSQIEYASDSLNVTKKPIQGTAQGVRLHALMTDAGVAETQLRLERLALGVPPALQVEKSTARLVTQGNDLTGDLAVITREADVTEFKSEKVSKLDSLFDQKLPFALKDGTLTGKLHARDASGVINGALDMSMFGIRAQTTRMQLELDGNLHLDIRRYSVADDSSTLEASSSFARVGVCAMRNATKVFPCGSLQRVAIKGAFALHGQQVAGSVTAKAASISRVRVGAPGSSRFTGRMLSANGSLMGARRSLQADLTVKFTEFHVQSKDASLRFRPALRIVMHNVDVASGNGALDAALKVSGWHATFGDDGGQCSLLMLPDADVAFTGMIRAGRPSGRVTARVEHASVAWGADFKAQGDILVVANALIPGTSNDPATLRGSLHLLHAVLRGGKGASQGWEARMPDLQLDAIAEFGKSVAGSLKLQVLHASGRIGGTRLATSVTAEVPKLTFEGGPRTLQFSGRFRVQDMQMGSGTRRIEKWWAEIDATSGLLTFQNNLDVSANFRAMLRDATPALAILAGDRKLPNWLANVVPLRQLQTEGVVERRCRLTDIQFTQATGGPLVAHGRLQSTSELVRGAFLVRVAALKPLSLGVTLGPPDAGVSPLVGDAWLHDHLDQLSFQARRLLSTPCRSSPGHCMDSDLSSGN